MKPNSVISLESIALARQFSARLRLETHVDDEQFNRWRAKNASNLIERFNLTNEPVDAVEGIEGWERQQFSLAQGSAV